MAQLKTCCDPSTELGKFEYYKTFLGNNTVLEYHCGSCDEIHCSPGQCDPPTEECPCDVPSDCHESECCDGQLEASTEVDNVSFHALGTGTLRFSFSYTVSADTAHEPPCAVPSDPRVNALCEIKVHKEGSMTYLTLDEISASNMQRSVVPGHENQYFEIDETSLSGAVVLGLDWPTFDGLAPCKYIIEIASGGIIAHEHTGPTKWGLVSATDEGMVLKVDADGDCCTADNVVIIYDPPR